MNAPFVQPAGLESLSNEQCAYEYKCAMSRHDQRQHDALHEAVRCGCILLAVKARLPRGPFADWCQRHGINQKRAGRQVRLAAKFGSPNGILDQSKLDAAVMQWNFDHGQQLSMQIKTPVSVNRAYDLAGYAHTNAKPSRPVLAANVPASDDGDDEFGDGDDDGSDAWDADMDGVAIANTPDDEPDPDDFIEPADFAAAHARWRNTHAEGAAAVSTPAAAPDEGVQTLARPTAKPIVKVGPQLTLDSLYDVASQTKARIEGMTDDAGRRQRIGLVMDRAFAECAAILGGAA